MELTGNVSWEIQEQCAISAAVPPDHQAIDQVLLAICVKVCYFWGGDGLKRVIMILFGMFVISFVLLMGINLIGSPVPIVTEKSIIPVETELKPHEEGGPSQIQLFWWRE